VHFFHLESWFAVCKHNRKMKIESYFILD